MLVLYQKAWGVQNNVVVIGFNSKLVDVHLMR